MREKMIASVSNLFCPANSHVLPNSRAIPLTPMLAFSRWKISRKPVASQGLCLMMVTSAEQRGERLG